MSKRSSADEIATPDEKKAKKKHMLITLETKYFVINGHLAGMSPAIIAKKFGIGRRTVYTILRRKDKYLEDMKKSGSIQPNSFRNPHISTHVPEMERVLDSWIKDQTHRLHLPVTYDAICDKAVSAFGLIKDMMGVSQETFTPSKRWFERFRRRTGWHNSNIKGAEYADMGHFIKQLDGMIQKHGYHYSQIFNVDETSLYWKLLPPDRYIPDNEMSMSYFKATKDRITLLLGGNASGDYKLKPVVVHHEENPKALQGMDKSTLPVVWKPNEKPWITTVLFEDWLINDFLPDVKKYTDAKDIPLHILLIVENTIGHLPGLQNFSHPNIKLMFMPPNAKSLLEPIISTFKAHYLRLAFSACLKARDPITDSFEKFAKSFTILEAIKIIDKSWERIIKNDMINIWSLLFPRFDVKIEVQTDPSGYTKDELEAIVNIAEQLEIEASANFAKDPIPFQETQNVEIKMERPMVEVKCEPNEVPYETFTLEALHRAFEHLDQAIEIFSSQDPNTERNSKVVEGIKNACSYYCEKYEEMKRECGKKIKKEIKTEDDASDKPSSSSGSIFHIKEEVDLGEFSI